MEITLLFFKPDGLHLQRVALYLVRRKQLSIKSLGSIRFNETIIRSFYPQLNDRAVALSVTFLEGHDLPVYIVTGENAVRIVKDIKKRIREKRGKGRTGSIIHSTNHPNEFAEELANLQPHLKQASFF
ncbi:MAG: hypothetical protein ABIA83_01440 [Patescibacteria group bacterium]